MIDVTKINAIVELEHYAIKFEYTGSQDELKVNCPFHKDENPSCFLNIKKNEFKCHTAGCEKSGDLVTLLAAKLKTARANVIVDISRRYSIDNDSIIDFATVERYFTEQIPTPLMHELNKRAIFEADLKQYRIGFDLVSNRITIPIRNHEGFFVNIRKYLPGAPGPEKMRNSKGRGKMRLFPIEQLKYETIVICGGELKAIVAARELNKHNIGAICATAGEDNWSKELFQYFISKYIIICYDIDEAGRSAASILARNFQRIAKSIRILTLPLDITKYPKGDINDYVAHNEYNTDDLFNLLSSDNCKDFNPASYGKQVLSNDDEPLKVNLAEAISANIVGTRIETSGILLSLDTAPYVVPKVVYVSCDRSQKLCSICGIFRNKEDQAYTINSESASLLELVHSRKSAHREALMQELSIPKKCPIAEFHINDYYNCEDARISPQLEITDRASERILQPSLIISDDTARLELNEPYVFIGRNWPHPQSQQSTLVLSKYKQTTDALSNFKLTDEYKQRLKVFESKELTYESVNLQLETIYADLSANVTRIFKRESLHLCVDLGYHSPLFMDFDGGQYKGWAEVLIIGDSAQGKSETAMKMKEFYNLGEKVESKNASVAGLLGGLQKTGDRWFVSWGVFPQQDKRLIIMEELKGADVSVISKLTDMRSSGVAEIPKIEKRRTHARTRLIAISNSRSGRDIGSYTYGIKAIEELIGSIEDVRRFDLALVCGKDEIKADELNQLQSSRPVVQHKFTKDLCRNLILWAWSAKNCYFESDTEKYILDQATALSNKFHDSIPLIDKGSTRLKIARLAASLAARLFSHDEEYNILVRKCHAEYIVKFMDQIYSSSVFGYEAYSKAILESEALHDEEEIISEFSVIQHPKEFCKRLLYANSIDQVDIQDFYGCDREVANKLVSLLVRKNALKRIKGRYYKNQEFINKLKYWCDNGVLTGSVPDYLKKEKAKF